MGSLHLQWMKTAVNCPKGLTKLLMVNSKHKKKTVDKSTLLCYIFEYIQVVIVALLSREKVVCPQQELGSFPAELVALVVGLWVVALSNCSAWALSDHESGLCCAQGGSGAVCYPAVCVQLQKADTML